MESCLLDIKQEQKCIVLFSGGLDSRIAVKLMHEKGFFVKAVFFNLPFIKEDIKEIRGFCKKNNVELEVFDCTQGELLQEYLDVLRKPLFNRGKGYNPCIDCKIFILKKTKEFADKEGIDLIVTGDVLGERALSQSKKSIRRIDENSEVEGRVFRPLSAKLLDKIKSEEENSLDKEDFYDIQGRKREKQFELAKRFGIDFPNPSGGCLLCEPALKNRFKKIFDKDLNEEQIKLLKRGRHFMMNDLWIVLGRNEKENKFIEDIFEKENQNIIISDYPGPTAVFFDFSREDEEKDKEEIKGKVLELIKAYSKKGSERDRDYWERYKI